MTAGPYADAAGLVERSAAAYAAAVPVTPEDDGFFGPASVAWRVSADLAAPVAGLRSLLIQALHPLAMAGVDQHSDWRTDPVGRLAATSAYEVTVTFGDRASATRAARRVRAVHEHVRGVDPVTGQPYAAGDPALLLWVHAALVDSGLAASALFGTPLTAADADRYVAEMTIAAELLGVPHEMVPDSVAALDRYFAGVRADLRRTPAAAESMSYLLDPPGLDEDIAELWQDIRDAAVLALPGWAIQMYGYAEPPPLTAERRTEIRQALGVLDAVFLGEPGRARGPAADHRADALGRQEAGGRNVRARRLAIAAGIGAVSVAALTLLRGRRNGLPGLRRLRLERGLAAVRLAARGGARYATSAPRLFASAGEHRAGAAQRPGPADRRGRRRHPGDDEGRADEAGPDGQLRRRRPVPRRPADAEPAAGQRAPDEPGTGRPGHHRRAGPAAGPGLRHLGSRAHRGRLDRAGAPGDHPGRPGRRGEGAVPGHRRDDRGRPGQRRAAAPDAQDHRADAGRRRAAGRAAGTRHRGTRLPPGGPQPADVRALLRRPPHHRRARHRARALHPPGGDQRAGRRRAVRRASHLVAGRARPGRRDDLPLRVPQPVRGARVQRRPAPGELPVPSRRAGHLPGFRAGQVLHRRRAPAAGRDGQAPVRGQRPGGLPPRHGGRGLPDARRAAAHGHDRRAHGGVLRHGPRARPADHDRGLRLGRDQALLRLPQPARRLRADPQVLRDPAADQPGPVRAPRRAVRDRGLALHRRGDLALRPGAAVHPDGRRRGRVARWKIIAGTG